MTASAAFSTMPRRSVARMTRVLAQPTFLFFILTSLAPSSSGVEETGEGGSIDSGYGWGKSSLPSTISGSPAGMTKAPCSSRGMNFSHPAGTHVASLGPP